MPLPDAAPPDDAASFAALSQDLIAEDEQATLRRICVRALEVVPGAELCGVTVRARRGRLHTPASTDDLAVWADDLQYELGEGPCVDAALEGESFLVPSIADDPRWPAWTAKVSDAGLGSLVSVQLPAPGSHVHRERVGALNIYARAAHRLDGADLERARVFGVHAGTAFATARTVDGLREAVAGRHAIGLAQGIVMARYGLDADRAFDLLTRYANAGGVKVRVVAADVVERGDLPPAAETPSADGPD